MSSGGTQSIIEASEIHPKNREILLKCADQFKLHTIGIDVIAKDIKNKSWLESSFAIIEVNSVPQIGIDGGAQAYKEFIKTSIPNNGHIPTHIAVGTSNKLDQADIKKLFLYASRMQTSNISCKECLILKRERASRPFENNFLAATTLLRPKHVDSALIYMSIKEVLENGLPTKNIDSIALFSNKNDYKENELKELALIAKYHVL